MVVIGVWITSALYSIPRFIFARTVTNIHENGMKEQICIQHRGLFDSRILDSINFAALYLLPLLVMTVSVCLSFTFSLSLFSTFSALSTRLAFVLLAYCHDMLGHTTHTKWNVWDTFAAFQLLVNDIGQSDYMDLTYYQV